jgi:hypothetical protein
MALRRGRGLLGRRRFTWVMAVLLGTTIGFGVAGFPDPRTFSLVDERVPVTVAPGALQPVVTGTTTTVPDADGTPENAELPAVLVALAQATEVPGVVARYTAGLEQVGYTQIISTVTDPVDVSRVYATDAALAQAQLLALDLGIVEPIEPMASAPLTDPPVVVDVLVILGRDLQ